MKTLLLIGSILLAATPLSQAAVSLNNIRLAPGSVFPEANYTLTVYQDPQADDPTTIWFNFSGNQLTFISSNVDEASDWYFVFAGDLFSASAISNDEFLPFVKADFGGFHTNVVNIPAGRFFLGVNTGTGFTAEGPRRQFFGWVELAHSFTSLTLVSSAMTYDAPAIVVGSTTSIPEPSAGILWFSGLAAGFGIGRRRRRKGDASIAFKNHSHKEYRDPKETE